jgi:hypothetical protein
MNYKLQTRTVIARIKILLMKLEEPGVSRAQRSPGEDLNTRAPETTPRRVQPNVSGVAPSPATRTPQAHASTDPKLQRQVAKARAVRKGSRDTGHTFTAQSSSLITITVIK